MAAFLEADDYVPRVALKGEAVFLFGMRATR